MTDSSTLVSFATAENCKIAWKMSLKGLQLQRKSTWSCLRLSMALSDHPSA